MFIASIADLHFGRADLQAARAQWEAALAECVKRKVDLITIAGDVFDKPNIGDAHASTGAIVRAVLEPMKGLGIDFLIIPGNHDKAGPASQDALTVFDSMPNVTVERQFTQKLHCGKTLARYLFAGRKDGECDGEVVSTAALRQICRSQVDGEFSIRDSEV